MNLDKKNILHLADLAKLTLNDQEVEAYTRQLSDILIYLEKIKKLNLAKIKESLSGVDAKYAMPPRPDEVVASNPEAIKQAFKLANNFVVAPHVFDNDKNA